MADQGIGQDVHWTTYKSISIHVSEYKACFLYLTICNLKFCHANLTFSLPTQ